MPTMWNIKSGTHNPCGTYVWLTCIHSFIHLAVCLTTGPKPLPKRALHIVRSRASSFKWEYPLLSLRSSSSFLRLIPRLPVTSILPFIFPSTTRYRRQFIRKMWPIQLAFRFLISCSIFLCSLTLVILLHFSHDRSNWSFPLAISQSFKMKIMAEIQDWITHMEFCVYMSHCYRVLAALW